MTTPLSGAGTIVFFFQKKKNTILDGNHGRRAPRLSEGEKPWPVRSAWNMPRGSEGWA